MNPLINNLCDLFKDDPALAVAIMDILFKDKNDEREDD